MDRAMLELLEKKEFEYITVKELCEKADVNRSTFYLHYDNTVELLQEATRYVIDRFLSYFLNEEKPSPIDFETCPSEELIFISAKYILPYLNFIRENRRVFLTTLRHLGTMGLDTYYETMFRKFFTPILARFGVPEPRRPYVIKFYLTGVTAIVMEWIRGGCRDSLEMISETIVDCIFNDGTKEKNS